jgi:ATP-binding cassette subfamily B protein
MNADSFPKTYKGFYWLIIKKFPWYFGTIFCIEIIGTVMSMVFSPLTSKWMMQIFENAVSADWAMIIPVFMYMVILYGFDMIIQVARSIIFGRKQQIFNRYKIYVLYKRIYDNDISFFIDRPGGRILSDAQRVSGELNTLTNAFYSKMLGSALGFLFLVGSMATMNIWLLVALLTYGIIKVIWEWQAQRKLIQNSKLIQVEDSKYAGMRSDSLNNALTVKYFANTEYENKYIYDGRKNLIKLFQRSFFLSRCQWIPTSVLWHITRFAMLLFCFVLIKNGDLSISNAVFVMASIGSINSAFNNINKTLQSYTKTSATVKKAYENIIMDKVITDKENAKNLSVKNADITFHKVGFGYGKNSLFTNFNLTVNKSEKVGIVGLSGAGKTTICYLLLRMYDVQDGKILINGTDIRDVTQDSLRKSISYVPQEATLFNRTILENIRYAKPRATRAEVIEAAKKANIHDFIMSLPKGYNTLVGNNGIKLSGGQRQRVSIARALLKDAPILMLDEATSALDSENEMLIQKSLQKAMAGKTTLVIAHRLSTLKNMDRIVVIKNGKIIETGTHNQLVHKKGAYSKLWHIQTHKK